MTKYPLKHKATSMAIQDKHFLTWLIYHSEKDKTKQNKKHLKEGM